MFYTEFPTLAESGEIMALTYFFLPLEEEDYKKFLDETKIFEKIIENKFTTEKEELAKLIKENGIDIFLDITINKIIFNLILNYQDNKKNYEIFSNYIKSLFNSNDDFKDELKNLLDLFYDENQFSKKIWPKLSENNDIINISLLESIFYGFKYCVNVLDNKNLIDELLYSSFFKKDGINIINTCYIPGIDSVEDFHLLTLDSIVSHFSKYADDWGCYVCSCGFYYNIEPCGFPTPQQAYKCPKCDKDIGYGKKKIPHIGSKIHGMVIRDGHLRIFKDEKQRDDQLGKYNEVSPNFPNMTLDDYQKKVINPIRNQVSTGFNSISREFFENQNKNVRKLSIIGYRLLNYISYCHLFFAYCLGYITEDNLKKCLIKDMNILKIIETNWNLLKESLQKRNINSIQIFMNMIFKKLSKQIKKCK